MVEGKQLRILIAEDDPGLALILKQILEGKGCSVSLATDGLEALEILAKERFQLVFTDIRMPRMDGFELLKKIESRGINVPVILMSGFSDHTAEEIDECDGVVLIEKPFSRKQIEEIIDDYAMVLPDSEDSTVA